MRDKMRLIAIIAVLALLMTPCSAADDFDYLGTNQKYAQTMEGVYKDFAEMEDIDFLEVDCFFWEDYVSFSVVVDNKTVPGAAPATIPALNAYLFFYNSTRWPEKAEIYVKEPNGERIVSATVYSRWADDYLAETDKSVAWNIILTKFADTIF